MDLSRAEPFRDLLEQALADSDLTRLDLRTTSGKPVKCEKTRPDRPRYLSEDDLYPAGSDDDHPFRDELLADPSRNDENLGDDDGAPYPEMSLDELADETLGAEPTLEDTLSESLLPTRPFDLRPLAELARVERSLPPLVVGEQVPVAVGLATNTWRVNHDGEQLELERLQPLDPLEPLSADPLPLEITGEHPTLAPARPAPTDPPAGDGFSLEHLDEIAHGVTVDVERRPAPDSIEPNHRQRNTAENFYKLGVDALASGDKKLALTHLRTAAALDPTVSQYKLMIRDLQPAKPAARAGATPVVKGRPVR